MYFKNIPLIIFRPIVLTLFLISPISIIWAQRGNGNEIRLGLGLEYAITTKAIMPSFLFSTPSTRLASTNTFINLFFKFGAGPEDGYFAGNTKSSAIESYLKSNMEGDQLISYKYNDLSGGLALSFSVIPTFIIPTKKEIKNNKKFIKNWIYFGIGLQVTNHTKTIGSYTTVSRDLEFEYTAIERFEFHPRFFDFSPTVTLFGKKIGMYYSMQSVFDKSVANHTIGITYLFPY
jgi:hypothetical protein